MDAGRIDLDRARREAKRRVKAAREEGGELRLSDAQRAVARELGEASWPRLVRRVEAEAVAREDRARQLVEEATNGRRDHAEALLALDPELGRESFDAALVLGDADRVRAALAADPGLATRPTGARDWLPLLYPCHSAFLGGERTDGLVACARALLDAGADPDSSWQHPEFGSLGALYGAAGVAHEPRMTALLLEAGANPDDDESVYHATETADDACLRLLLDAGAKVEGTNAIAHCLDVERPDDAAAAARPRARPRGRALAAVGGLPRALAGGDPHARGRRRRRGRVGRAERAHAVRARVADRAAGPLRAARRARRAARDRAGRRADRPLLRRRPRRRAAAAAAYPDRVERIRTEFAEALHQAAAEGRREAVELLLELGVPIGRPGQMGGTPLHHAAWWGHDDGVAALLDAGADAGRAASPASAAPPLGWTATARSTSPARRGRRHRPRRIAWRLVQAGAEIEPDMIHEAAPEFAAWLEVQAAEPEDLEK